MSSGWTGRGFGVLSGRLIKTGRKYINTDRDGNETELDEVRSFALAFDPSPAPEEEPLLSVEQHDIIIGTLNSSHSDMLHDPEVQAGILRKIKGVLSKIKTDPPEPDKGGSYARTGDALKALEHAFKQAKRLSEGERDSLDLIGWVPDALEAELVQGVEAVRRLNESLEMGKGEKYGTAKGNQAQLLKAALESHWDQLGLPTGRNSNFDNFYKAVRDQLLAQPSVNADK